MTSLAGCVDLYTEQVLQHKWRHSETIRIKFMWKLTSHKRERKKLIDDYYMVRLVIKAYW